MAYAEKRDNGTWRARWQLDEHTANGRRKEGSEDGFRTKTLALKYARDREAEIRAGTYIDPKLGKRTVAQWWAQWLPAQDLAPGSLKAYGQQWRTHIQPRWGGVPLDAVLGIDIETWVKQLRAVPLSDSTINIITSALRGLFDSAVHNRMIRHSPMPPKKPGARKRKNPAAPPREGVVAPLAAIEQILTRLGSDADRLLVLLAVMTGMRWSELAAMRTRDLHLTPPGEGHAASGYYRIDPNDGALHQDEHSRPYLGPPKSGSAAALAPGYQPGRIIDLPPFLVLILLAYLQTLPATREGWLFPNRFGGPRRYETWNADHWRPACDGRAAYVSPTGRSVREALPAVYPGLWFHDLKHTHAAILNDLRIHPVMRDYRLGHVTPGAPGIYSHPTAQMRAELVDGLERFGRAWLESGLGSAWPAWRAPRSTPVSLPRPPQTGAQNNVLF